MSRSRRGQAWAVIAGLGLLLPAGLLAGLLLADDRLDGVAVPPAPLVAAVDSVSYEERVGVTVTLDWAEGAALLAPPWSGIVGQVAIAPGATLAGGDPVATIGGITRLAVSTPQPFHRPLARNDAGPDVAWLQQVLVDLGHLEAVTADPELVGGDVLAGIRVLAQSLGIRRRVDAFDPAWFVWLPADGFAVDRVALVAGGQAPAAGQEVVAGPPALAAAVLQPLEGGALQLADGVAYELAVDGTVVPVDAAGRRVAAEGLEPLAAALPPLVDSVPGSVRRVEPLAVWAVPAAAVQSGPAGGLCLWVEDGAGFASQPVTPVGGTAGATFVEPLPGEPPRILTNPAEILEDASCRSG